MNLLMKRMATFIALFVIFVSSAVAQNNNTVTVQVDDCHVSWLYQHWEDSTDYENLQQGLIDQLFQIKALQITDPSIAQSCIDSISWLIDLSLGDTTTIFSQEIDTLANKWGLLDELREYRSLAEQYKRLMNIAAIQDIVIQFLTTVAKLQEEGKARTCCVDILLEYSFTAMTLEELNSLKKRFYECQSKK